MKLAGKSSPTAIKDEDNFRYEIKPIAPKFSIGHALRAVKQTHESWRDIAAFCGLASQSDAFRIAYVNRSFPAKRALAEYLVIDGNTAYLYDKDHKPATVNPVHIPVEVKVSSTSAQEITQGIPTKVSTGIVVKDVLDRVLTMSVTPTNGYVVGMSDVNLCLPNATFVTRGNAKTLNGVLKQIGVVGIDGGDATLQIKIDDGEGKNSSVNTITLDLTVVLAPKVSVPEVTLPDSVQVVRGQDTTIAPITVSDEDGKILTLNVAPFGCEVYGFKSYLHVVGQGEARTVTGRPEYINADIASLVVRTDSECQKAQLGVELCYGKTIIRKYLVLDVVDSITPTTATKADEAVADTSKVEE